MTHDGGDDGAGAVDDGRIVRLDALARPRRDPQGVAGGEVTQALMRLLARRGAIVDGRQVTALSNRENRSLVLAIVEALTNATQDAATSDEPPLSDEAMVEILRAVHSTTAVALRELGEVPAV